MTTYVLDSSVAAKWFLPACEEPYSSAALQILDGFRKDEIRLLVPGLFWPECGNILWKAVRQARMTATAAVEAIEMLEAVQIATTSSRSLLKPAFAIARAFDRTVYDSTYVALAAVSGKPLITADERLANAFGAHFPIRWLGAW